MQEHRAKVRVALPADIESVLPLCSFEELRTLEDLYNEKAEALLRVAVYSSKVWTGLIDNTPVCMFGAYAMTMMSDTAYIWLLGSRQLREYPLLLFKHCRPVLEHITEGYSVVKSALDMRNPKAVRLANRLGFEIISRSSWKAEIELRKH